MISGTSSDSPVMAEHINRLNKILVLNILRQNKEISRADIVKISGLSAPTVTRIIESLVNIERLAVESGIGESSGGRPPLMVRFNSEENFVIGIDWGRTHIHGALTDLNAKIIYQLDIPVTTVPDLNKDLKLLNNLIETIISNSKVSLKKIHGIGLAVAGFVNEKSHVVEFSPNFGWKNVNIRQHLSQNFNLPVSVGNVSALMALGELMYGHGERIKDFVFVNIGYGIGAGIISGGKPFKGFDGYAGELGHIGVKFLNKFHSRNCVCGKTDCLECYASGRGITETVLKEHKKHKESSIHKFIGGDTSKINTELIAQLANSGDAFAFDVMNNSAEMLGHALATFSNLINPEAIIIGGKVALSGEFFIHKIEEAFNREILQKVKRPVKILKSALLGQAGVRGAIALILSDVMELKVNNNPI
ncbi:MAG: ROK family transcriptional regulator [Bacteroidales bacterium]|nr:ROK family transcriptional regulator [Bacteroidales bacterium]MBN2820434.1 ROK family transcriptional regulator [Bacteroidales bacterium]